MKRNRNLDHSKRIKDGACTTIEMMHTIPDTGKSTGVDAQTYSAQNIIQHEGRHKGLCTRRNVSQKHLNNARLTTAYGTCIEKEKRITF